MTSLVLLGIACNVGTDTAFAQSGALPAKPVSKPSRLTVATIERRPFAMQSKGKWVGFSVELWQEIAKELKVDFTFVSATSFPEMLKRVETRSADAAIANITITSAREQTLDFSQPIFDAGLQVMVRSGGTSIGLIGAIFNWEMLGLVVLAGVLLFGVANLMWFFERRAQPYFDYPYKEGIWRSFWWALNVILNGGFEERVPKTRRGRIFAVCLVIASLFVVSAFVAKITAALTVGELKSQIQSYRDLYGRRVGTTQGSTSAGFLDSRAISYSSYGTIEDLFKALNRRQIDAIVHDAPILAYYAANDGRGKVHVVGGLLRPEKYGIALPDGSRLAEPINRAILRLRESGAYDRILRRWFGDSYR
jgi:polar amino acid transport system substrate-binding protein